MKWPTVFTICSLTLLFVMVGLNLDAPLSLKREKRPPAPLTTTYGNLTDPLKNKSTDRSERKPVIPEGALPNERILTFATPESFNNFLSRASNNGIGILGGSPKRLALRVQFENLSDLSSILPDDAETLFNFPVFPPILEDGQLDQNAVGFFQQLRERMGITEDNSSFGEGVRVAVIDTGIMDHSVFSENTTAISLVDSQGEPHPHGTAMASIWRDAGGRLPSIAPAVDLLSIQVADETGVSDLFTISEAIFVAAEQGADLITISMGGLGTNGLLDQAVQFAKENGSLVIASAGNDGQEVDIFPAAHEDVLAIAAIDGVGNHPGFSNSGEFIAFSAPGVAIPSAGPDNTFTLTSGTSPAAQLGGATIAIAMSELGIRDPFEAATIVQENLNELGLPGDDNLFGEGFPQIDVILNHDVPGIHDAAIASNLLEPDLENNTALVQVVIDNPGTELLSDAVLEITAGRNSFQAPLPNIQPKESFLFDLPITVNLGTESVSVRSRVILENGLQDARPLDNGKETSFSLIESP